MKIVLVIPFLKLFSSIVAFNSLCFVVNLFLNKLFVEYIMSGFNRGCPLPGIKFLCIWVMLTDRLQATSVLSIAHTLF